MSSFVSFNMVHFRSSCPYLYPSIWSTSDLHLWLDFLQNGVTDRFQNLAKGEVTVTRTSAHNAVVPMASRGRTAKMLPSQRKVGGHMYFLMKSHECTTGIISTIGIIL